MPPSLDGHDTALARLLHARRRLDLATLRTCLEEVRSEPGEATLATLLIERGLVPAREVLDLLREVPPRPEPNLTASAQELFEAPTVRIEREDTAAPGDATPSARPTLRPGSRLGPWVLQEQLGAGGMGAVFLAQSDEGVRAAVKTLHLGGDEEDRARLLREVEAQGRFATHRNVIRVRSWGECNGVPYLVADLADGGSLHQRLRTGPLGVREAVRVVQDVALGLAHLHAHGVTHRDLKPANVLFDAEGTAKLVDFGLARFDGAHSLTQSGTLIGTIGYLAPEQVTGSRGGPPADVWALGCVLHACLTGGPPFGSGVGSVERVLHEDPPQLTSREGTVPPWLQLLYSRLLARDPLLRPSAAEAARLLRARRAALPGSSRLTFAGVALALVAGLGSGVAGAALVWRQDARAPAPGESSTGARDRTSGARTVVDPVPPPLDRPASPARARVWPLREGQELSVWLRTRTDLAARTGPGGRREQERTYWLAWRVRSVAPERVELRARVRRIRITWSWAAPESRGVLDTEVSAEGVEPLRGALEPEFSLWLDPRSGKALAADGVEALQEAVFQGLPDEMSKRVLYSLPELVSGPALCETLDALAALLPDDAPPPRRWRLTREVLARAGNQAALPAVVCEAEASPAYGAPGSLAVAWEGTLACETIVGRLSVTTQGGATMVASGRLLTSRVRETWDGALVGACEANLEVAEEGLEVGAKLR